MIKKIESFDFDSTMYFTPNQLEGEKVWHEKTGMVWPYNGWWSKKESLDLDIFHIPVNPFVYNKWVKATEDEETMTLMATGRLFKLKNEVNKILKKDGLFFDRIEFNPGMNTYMFKAKLFEQLINKYEPETFVMYDDRHEHLVEFEKWARFQPCTVEIVDVTKFDKTPKVIK